MAGANLEHFRLKVREYRLLVNRNQSDLAAYLNLDYNELSNRLNAHKNTRLSHENVRGIVRALAEWGAISTRGQAEELLGLMQCPGFEPVDLQAKPLSRLAADAPELFSTPAIKMVGAPTTTSAQALLDKTQAETGIEVLHNLPQQLSSFIGRYKEVAEVKTLLIQDKLRLVTLVGTGGSGKTRLAYKVGMEIAAHFPDGVWIVELAPLNNPALIPQAIAETLDVAEQPGRSILDTLGQYLRQRRVLLLLDNCEHMVEECSRVVQRLLGHSTGLQILATSREGLSIQGEKCYPVPSLSLPQAGDKISTEKVIEYEALQLFIERASNASPGFRLLAQDVPALVQVCRRLDGIPLALELAAARTRMLTLDQVQSRLDDRFQLLTEGSRDALPRQQTLRALVDWSYNLLSEGEKRLLARASVFAGSFDIQVAERVCGNNEAGLDGYEVLDALTNLANKSLLVVDRQDVEVRYWLLETIKQYAMEKLKESGEEEAIRDRHLAFYATLAEELGDKVLNEDQLSALKRLDQEQDNLRVAMAYGIKTDKAETILTLVSGLYLYWEIRGFNSEGQQYLEQALALPGAVGVSRGIALGWAGFMASQQGNIKTARTYFEEALALGKKHGDQKLLWHVYTDLGILYNKHGMHYEVRQYFEETIPLSEGLPLANKAVAMINLGSINLQLGEYDKAYSLIEEGLAIARKLDNGFIITSGLGNMANVAFMRQDYQAVYPYLKECLEVSVKFGYRNGIYSTLIGLSRALVFDDKLEEARKPLEESLTLGLRGGVRIELWSALLGVAGLLSRVWVKNREEGLLEKVAFLCGAARALLDASGQVIGNPSKLFYEQTLEISRSGLSDEAFWAAFTSGKTIPVEDASMYAQQALALI